MITLVFLIPLFLMWGSFLNVLAYRLIRGESIVAPRSHCPKCFATISWQDNIPLISWLLLHGKCRACRQPISVLYPLVELLTLVSMLSLVYVVPTHYFFPYFIFFSALIVTFRSDIETMLISRWVTLALVPFGLLFAYLGLLPISVCNSCAGVVLGYGFLFAISRLFFLLTGKVGLGDGDLELLACIGAFQGFIGCWITMSLASVVGSIVGIIYLWLTGADRSVKIPFGSFLAVSGMVMTILMYAWPLLKSLSFGSIFLC